MKVKDVGDTLRGLPRFRLGVLLLWSRLFFWVALASVVSNLAMGVYDAMLWTSLLATLGLFTLWMVLRATPKNLDIPAAVMVIGSLALVALGWFPFAGVLGSGPSLLFPLAGLSLAFTTRTRQGLALLGILSVAGLLIGAHILRPEWVEPYYPNPDAQLLDVAISQMLGIVLVGVLFLKMSAHHIKGWEELGLKQRENIELMQQSADQAEQELLSRLELTQRMGASLAHDVNNMLSVVMVSAELLEGEENEQTRQAIIDSAMTASHLVQRFRRAKSEQIERIKLAPALQSLLRSISYLAAHVDTSLVMNDEEAHIVASRVSLEQVVMNVCLNAVYAMNDGGQLTLTVTRTQDEYITMSFRDTGVGIHRDDLQHIFEPFFTTRKEGGGTGIGLANVRDIVTSWGGDIRVESVFGKGTVFTLRVPAG